jgi:hypothetical protein
VRRARLIVQPVDGRVRTMMIVVRAIRSVNEIYGFRTDRYYREYWGECNFVHWFTQDMTPVSKQLNDLFEEIFIDCLAEKELLSDDDNV